MASGTGPTSELNIRARIDGNTIILVLASDARHVNPGRLANIKAVSVVTTFGIAGRIIDGNVFYLEVLRSIDGKALDRSILDVESRDRAVC